MVTKERHGPWALIVGGSEGIAEALADKLGAKGINLILVARKPEALAATAEKVRAASGVEVRTLSLDVARADALERIRELTDDVEVGLLIHNVGGGGFGPLLDRTIESIMNGVMINCVNLMKLVHHYGQPMKARGAGGLITFGSMAGNVGGANMASYSASKAFTQLLFESLWSELQGSGIDVLSIVVGAADTPSRRRSGTQDNAMFPVALPEDVAEQALREIGNGPVQVPAGSEQAFATFNTPDRREAVDTIRRLLVEMSAR